MSPTMRRASGRSTRSSTSWSSSIMATRVSRGFALIRISLFIDARHTASSRRLGGRAVAELQRVGGEPSRMHLVDGGTRKECPTHPCDRPRRPRLERAAARSRRPHGRRWFQRCAERRAIGPLNQAVQRKQDERAQNGQDGVDRESAQIAHVPARVAERGESGRKRRGRHCRGI